ncbi:MAG: response regulator [Bacteroidetes bacterium]|nr:MAG: response regulator [Bacteroidota bacterium]
MGKKILIAEDSSVILNLTKKILVQQHYDISAAKDGEEVLMKLENENFDLILMDINIPKMDGMECSKQIRALADPEKSKTPIFAITGNAMNYSVEDFSAVGINEYLQKPIDFDKLVELVAKYIA